MSNIEDKICNSINIIAKRLVDKAKYDKVVKGKIAIESVNDGINYRVKVGNVFYKAVSIGGKIYQNGDMVYLLIPQNDNKNTKFILGKEDDYLIPNPKEIESDYAFRKYYYDDRIILNSDDPIGLENTGRYSASVGENSAAAADYSYSFGQSNIISGNSLSTYSSIWGGQNNLISNGSFSSIVGGRNNILKGNFNAILNGENNLISENDNVNFSTIVGSSNKIMCEGEDNGEIAHCYISGYANECLGTSALVSLLGQYNVAENVSSSFSIGNGNEFRNGALLYTIGYANTFSGGGDNFAFGKANELSNCSTNFVSGFTNSVNQSAYNTIIGISNVIENLSNSTIFGSHITYNAGAYNIFLGDTISYINGMSNLILGNSVSNINGQSNNIVGNLITGFNGSNNNIFGSHISGDSQSNIHNTSIFGDSGYNGFLCSEVSSSLILSSNGGLTMSNGFQNVLIGSNAEMSYSGGNILISAGDEWSDFDSKNNIIGTNDKYSTYNVAIGYGINIEEKEYAYCLGYGLSPSNDNHFVIGCYNEDVQNSDCLLTIGMGNDDDNRANALSIIRPGANETKAKLDGENLNAEFNEVSVIENIKTSILEDFTPILEKMLLRGIFEKNDLIYNLEADNVNSSLTIENLETNQNIKKVDLLEGLFPTAANVYVLDNNIPIMSYNSSKIYIEKTSEIVDSEEVIHYHLHISIPHPSLIDNINNDKDIIIEVKGYNNN